MAPREGKKEGGTRPRRTKKRREGGRGDGGESRLCVRVWVGAEREEEEEEEEREEKEGKNEGRKN